VAKKYSLLVGSINGVNRVFTLPNGENYAAGSIVLIHNGLTITRDDTEGFAETSATTITINNAPQTNDVIAAFYDDLTAENTVHDVTVQASTLSFQTDWNGQNYSIDYSVSLAKIDYNTSTYSLIYNSNGFVI